MPSVDPRCLHYGALGGAKEASHQKLQQTLQRRDTSSTTSYGSSSQSYPQFYSLPSRKPGDDGDFLMMGKGRK
ncbi:hypothetical protein Clacol_009635 [Clathrus columnatus]|uniref:Uncharacterized protein n=1 Tax=Clathrus columnatus TaxID=1419009 RepID=A0AAV5AL63_9AGAM|nr:hypothetical protein Clacol_009635 [Clathrus columnatus]